MSRSGPWPLVVETESSQVQTPSGPAFESVDTPPPAGFYLRDDGQALSLQQAVASPRDRGLTVDLESGEHRRRAAGGRGLALVRALGLHRDPCRTVLDTTCGMGRDSATLARLGAGVTSLERHPILHALVADARRRADGAEWLSRWADHHHADAGAWLATRPGQRFDAILIDPMFDTPRRKARPQKRLAWMHELIGIDPDVDSLLEIARARADRVVAVKQHARAPALGRPTRQLTGKAIRFDIYSCG